MELSADREAALKWQAQRIAQQVNETREALLTQLEAAGKDMWNSGACQAWLATAPDSVKGVSRAEVYFF